MKKIYLFITLFTLELLVVTITAQKTSVLSTSDFKPGWFVGANGGINWYFSEGNDFVFENTNKLVFLKNTGIQGALNLGYQFNPIYSLKGGLEFDKYHYATLNTSGAEFSQFIIGQKLNVDLLVNLTNLKKGYDSERKFTTSLFGGLGLGYYNANSTYSKIGGALRAGLQSDYFLNRYLALNIIVVGNFLTDNSNDIVVELPFEVAGGVLAGLSYRFHEKIKSKVIVPEFENQTEVKPEEVKPENNSELPVIQPEKPELAVVDTSKQTKPAVKPEIKSEPIAEVTPFKEYLFFKFNSRVIETNRQKETLAHVAEYLKNNPNVKVIVNGYADKVSGNNTINNEVSKRRAVNVANTLINKYGIKYNRIMVMWYGSKVQPFKEVWKNRVVILKSVNP